VHLQPGLNQTSGDVTLVTAAGLHDTQSNTMPARPADQLAATPGRVGKALDGISLLALSGNASIQNTGTDINTQSDFHFFLLLAYNNEEAPLTRPCNTGFGPLDCSGMKVPETTGGTRCYARMVYLDTLG
jgi:uncharacterized protein YdbL (DUF1318 family)